MTQKQQPDARIQQLTQEQAAAAEQIRTLQASIGAANSEKEAAEARPAKQRKTKAA